MNGKLLLIVFSSKIIENVYSVYSINRKNPHFKAANNGIDAVFETVYADIIVPYNIKDELKIIF